MRKTYDKFGQTKKGNFDIQPVNSFHVETCVCLDKKKPKDYVEIGVDAEDYYRMEILYKEHNRAPHYRKVVVFLKRLNGTPETAMQI